VNIWVCDLGGRNWDLPYLPGVAPAAYDGLSKSDYTNFGTWGLLVAP